MESSHTGTKEKKWFGFRAMFVIGCITAEGAIIARATDGSRPSHEPAESRGKRWRWDVWRQRWGAVFGDYELTKEERFLVTDWLVRHGFTDDNSCSRS